MVLNKLIASAVRLGLKSQLDDVAELRIQLLGKNRQTIKGYIPEVLVNTDKAVYQQLHFTTVEVRGTNIKINLTQIKQKKPLQLLEPIVVELKASISAQDAKNSMDSPLLQAGLTDIATQILAGREQSDRATKDYYWRHIYFKNSSFYFSGEIKQLRDSIPIEIETKIELENSHTLSLLPLAITTLEPLKIDNKPVTFDFGKETAIAFLDLNSERLALEGTITVYP